MDIAFCYKGSDAHVKDRFRSTPIELWEPLFALPNTCWHNVTKDAPTPERVNILTPTLTDFEDTARIIEACDLTITVDTSVAHLAGSLGLPYWLLLHQPSEWRWGQTGTTTVWYPLATLYRQPAPGAWDHVFQRLHADLLGLIAQREAAAA